MSMWGLGIKSRSSARTTSHLNPYLPPVCTTILQVNKSRAECSAGGLRRSRAIKAGIRKNEKEGQRPDFLALCQEPSSNQPGSLIPGPATSHEPRPWPHPRPVLPFSTPRALCYVSDTPLQRSHAHGYVTPLWRSGFFFSTVKRTLRPCRFSPAGGAHSASVPLSPVGAVS